MHMYIWHMLLAKKFKSQTHSLQQLFIKCLSTSWVNEAGINQRVSVVNVKS